MNLFILVPIVFLGGISFGVFIGFLVGFAWGRRAATKSIMAAKPVVQRFRGRFLSGFGVVWLLIALIAGLYDWHFTRTASRATGTITEMLRQKDKDGDTSYAPTFQFRDPAGKLHTVSSYTYQAPPAYHIGDQVPVIYSVDDPESAFIDHFFEVWGFATVAAILGIGCLSAGLIMINWRVVRGLFTVVGHQISA